MKAHYYLTIFAAFCIGISGCKVVNVSPPGRLSSTQSKMIKLIKKIDEKVESLDASTEFESDIKNIY